MRLYSLAPAPAAVFLLLAATAMAYAPLTGQQAVAQPPESAPVHAFGVADWTEPMCAGASEWAFELPAHHWIEMPVGWIAVDEATARQNWQHMRYELEVDGEPVVVAGEPHWQTQQIQVECPGQTIRGTLVAPVVYLPPLTGERVYRFTLMFDEDVNDGWSTFEKGSSLTVTATLRPRG
jgi:hypothetical protein